MDSNIRKEKYFLSGKLPAFRRFKLNAAALVESGKAFQRFIYFRQQLFSLPDTIFIPYIFDQQYVGFRLANRFYTAGKAVAI